MNTKLAMVGLLAMLTLPACQSGSSVSGGGGALSGGGEGTFAAAMSQVDPCRTALLLWVQGMACAF